MSLCGSKGEGNDTYGTTEMIGGAIAVSYAIAMCRPWLT